MAVPQASYAVPRPWSAAYCAVIRFIAKMEYPTAVLGDLRQQGAVLVGMPPMLVACAIWSLKQEKFSKRRDISRRGSGTDGGAGGYAAGRHRLAGADPHPNDRSLQDERDMMTQPHGDGGRFKVVRHVREAFSCRLCETVLQTPARVRMNYRKARRSLADVAAAICDSPSLSIASRCSSGVTRGSIELTLKGGLYAPWRTRLHTDWQSTVGPLG